jgi:hypothetical protein
MIRAVVFALAVLVAADVRSWSMTEKDIQKQLRFAASVVKQWPAWKRNILVHSAQPTNSQSRPPVSNQATKLIRSEVTQ